MISCSGSWGGGEGGGYVTLYSQTMRYGHPVNTDNICSPLSVRFNGVEQYTVKSKLFFLGVISSVATEEPVIAEPYICGGIPIDETFFALVLMSDGVYNSIEEAADMEINSNFDVVRLVTEELQCQNNLTGVAQAVVDRIGRAHHDTYMNQMRKCQKRDDMTLLIRIFKEEIANSLKSPRAAGRQAMSGRD